MFSSLRGRLRPEAGHHSLDFGVQRLAPMHAFERAIWRHAGGDDPRVAIEAAVAAVKRAKRQPNWDRAPASAAPGGSD